ncbi:MAG: helix-turn-helix domain-containing protein [Candidatus Rokuibacteriota bacterium]
MARLPRGAGAAAALDPPESAVTHRPRSSGQASPTLPPSRLLTVWELADLLQVPPKTIYAWRYKGKGPTALPVGKYLRFRPEDVAAWLEERAEPAQQVPRGGGDPNLGPARPRRRAPSTPSDGRHNRPGNSPSS